MRVGIDCRTILNPGYGEHAGVGHYTFYLISNLLKIDRENQYVLFFDRLLTKEAVGQLVGDRKNVEIKFFPFHQYKHYLPFAFSHILVSAALERERLDVFHSPAYTLPLAYKGRGVITVHDLAIYKHPEWFPKGQDFSIKTLVPQSLKKAKKIIAVSEHTQKDIQEIFKIKKEKIEVIYEGVPIRDLPDKKEGTCGLEKKICWDDLRAKYGLREEYVLFLGTIEPRKNIVAMVAAFCNLIKKNQIFGEKYQLVLAGAKGWKYDSVFEEIKKCKKKMGRQIKSEAIKYIGYVPGKDKFALMKYAACFIFPSLYEGFGLPVLEAMSLGVPTITSNISSLPEIVGAAAVLINPKKEEEIGEAVEKILTDNKIRSNLSKKGIVQAKKFSWEKCARETLKVYESAL